MALKVLRIKAHRNTCVVGDLMSGLGWTKKDIVQKLEEKRKVKSQKYYDTKMKKAAAKATKFEKDGGEKKLAQINNELKKYGF